MAFFLEVGLWAAAVFGAVYFIYLIFFSGHERLRKQRAEERSRHRFERREMEKGERRKESAPPPEPTGDRRKSFRR